MEMPQRERLLALGAGPQTDHARLLAFPFFRQVNLRETIRAEGVAFAIFADGVETEGRFSLATTATGLGGALFHDEINMKTPPGFGNDATLGLMAYQ
jgi:hypothetical protein